jgi:hypothetical protein
MTAQGDSGSVSTLVILRSREVIVTSAMIGDGVGYQSSPWLERMRTEVWTWRQLPARKPLATAAPFLLLKFRDRCLERIAAEA